MSAPKNVVGSYQYAFELCWAAGQDSLAGGEKVSLTSAFLSDGLCLQVLHDFDMFSLE